MKFYRIRESIGAYPFGMIVGFEDWELGSLLDELAEEAGFAKGHLGARDFLRNQYFEEISLQ